LDHCSVPGRTNEEFLSKNEVEIGMGIHNEPGVHRLSRIPSSTELASMLLKYLLDKSDPDRGFVPFNADDDAVLMVNNLGSISNLELSAFTNIVTQQLHSQWKVSPKRIYMGGFMTALNGPGLSVTLLNLSRLSDPSLVLSALDAPTTAIGWSGNIKQWTHPRTLNLVPSPPEQDTEHITVVSADPILFANLLRGATSALIAAEPKITKYDTIGTPTPPSLTGSG
jgi:triose/dihydroxyacetone kinase / FAD-AMP lyase (cyclizing)